MSEPRRTAHALVQVVLEVETGTWGPECTMGQIVKQARESAAQNVSSCFGLGPGGIQAARGIKLREVGKVDVRIVEEKS